MAPTLLLKATVTFGGLAATGVAVLVAGFSAAAQTEYVSAPASSDIPAPYLQLYQQDASLCPGLGWPVLAGVGKVETDHGRAPLLTSPTGAQGPMQFEPATWSRYGVDADADGRADPFDPIDAIASAASYLCSLGAARDTRSALIAYNCGNSGPACQAVSAGYASLVLSWASRYAVTPAGGQPAGAAGQAVRAALDQLGVPYQWGGEGPDGFDCSGLVQWAYARAGILLPRVAQDQYDAGPRIPLGAALTAGDLVFFGADSGHVVHVGIYLGDGRMVDAPHTGAVVRVEPLVGFTPAYLGATRPTGGS